jgi:tRNA 2-thiouridine synthesizing protein E
MSAALAGANDIAVEVDEEGYLLHVSDWTPEIAAQLAAQQQLTLVEAHWDIIHAIREFYSQYQRSPTTRVLLKYLAQQLGADRASSIYVMQLFGDGTPAKTVARLAGLPKPTNCI